jgi:hypothetical protein
MVSVQTVNKIDLSNVSTLYCNCTSSGGSYQSWIMVGESVKDYTSSNPKSKVSDGGIVSLDVSTLSGEYYIYFCASGVATGEAKVYVSEVWGE